MQADKISVYKTTENSPIEHLVKFSIDFDSLTLPVSHNGKQKNILVMVDQLTSWPIATAIPDKEAAHCSQCNS